MTEENPKGTPAAYLPFKTFMSSIEALEGGIPKRLDRTIWRSQSGVVQGQIMMALRFFGLLTDNDEPTPALYRFVEGKELRTEQMGSLLQHAYRDILDHDLTKMTPKMLEDAIGHYNVSGETKRKAVGFFLRAAKFADLPMHPFLATVIREIGTSPRRKRAKTSRNGESNIPPNAPEAPASSGTSRKTINLKSGGSVTLEISANPFLMSPTDRTFVFELIDNFHTYGDSSAVDADETETVSQPAGARSKGAV